MAGVANGELGRGDPMSNQHLHELFIDGHKVDQFVTDDDGNEVKEDEIENHLWTHWISRMELEIKYLTFQEKIEDMNTDVKEEA